MSLIDHEFLAATVSRTAERLAQDMTGADAAVFPTVRSTLDRDVSSTVCFEQYGREFRFRADESVGRAGRGEQPSPMRYLLTSIATCAQVWCAKTAAVQGERLDRLEIDVTCLLDMRGEHQVGDIPPYPRWFFLDVRLDGPRTPAAARGVVEEALRRCPVTSLMALAVPVHVRVSLGGAVVAGELPPEMGKAR